MAETGTNHCSDLGIPVDLNDKWGGNFTEKKLIESRGKKNLSQNEFVCAYHRYTLGTNWRLSQLFQHPLHQGSTAKKAKRNLRTALWLVYKSIEKQFPGEFLAGGLICTMHRHMEGNKRNDVSDDTQLAPYSDFSPQTPASPCNADTSKEDLDSFIDTATDISPIKIQMMSSLEDYCV